MGLFSRRSKPKIKVETVKKDSMSGWIKCSGCSEIIHAKELEANNNCCPKCNFHYRFAARERIAALADGGSFVEKFSEIQSKNSLDFVDTKKYDDRLAEAKEKSGNDEAAIVGSCLLQGIPIALGVLDFNFLGGSMGSVVGERITRLIEFAHEEQIPLVIVSASGGARMQESVLSLMQMAKTSAALAKFQEKELLYISILTNPTTGGVIASFASLGDIILAEPDALIAFAGPRVVEQTIGEKLPPGAQRSKFLLEKGMIDAIVSRNELKKKIAFFLEFFTIRKEQESLSSLEETFFVEEKRKVKTLLQVSENQNARSSVKGNVLCQK